LIKALEENGIGRPSTYASILANIRGREYVTTEKGRFRPTELGFLVIHVLLKSFPDIFDLAFTAQMENRLDKIEKGKVKWTKVLEAFHGPFEKDLEKARKEMKGEILTDLSCPECQKPLTVKSGRNGLFLGCTGYPDCRYTTNFHRDEKGKIVLQSSPDQGKEEGICEKCGKPMVVKNGRYGAFLACTGYPDCRNTLPRNNGTSMPPGTEVSCPEEGCKGVLVERISKKGKKFYACNQYPDCRFVMWNEPAKGVCPLCGTPVFEIKRPKKSEPIMKCRKKGCNFSSPLPSEDREG
jgi:DNA topoisomerase-1